MVCWVTLGDGGISKHKSCCSDKEGCVRICTLRRRAEVASAILSVAYSSPSSRES